MGILDSTQRVIDMVLTAEGRRQLSLGELRFDSFSLFDDGIDYDPIFASGSMTSEQIAAFRNLQIENTVVLEAVAGYESSVIQKPIDGVNVRNFLFTGPQGQKTLPRASFDPDITSGSIQVDQRKVQTLSVLLDLNGKTIQKLDDVVIGSERTQSSTVTIDVDVDDFFPEFSQEGFAISVFASSSIGLSPIDEKRDTNDDSCYGPELKAFADKKFRIISDSIRTRNTK